MVIFHTYVILPEGSPWLSMVQGKKSKKMLALTVRTDLNQALIVSPNMSQSLDQFINAWLKAKYA